MEIQSFSVEFVPNDCLIYANNIYTIQPNNYRGPYIHGFHGWIQRNFATLLKEKVNASNLKPNVFALCNRKKGMSRYIGNFNKIFNIISKKYKYKFVIFPDSFKNLKETIRNFASLRWIFIATGSGVMNTMFMSKGSGVCVAGTRWNDRPALSTLATGELKAVVFMDNTWPHYSKKPKKLNLTITFEMIDKSMKLINA